MRWSSILFFLVALTVLACDIAAAADLRVLFMGDNGHHRPIDMFHQLAPVLEKRGIELKYSAWGHDERTWSNPGFQNLVERGIPLGLQD